MVSYDTTTAEMDSITVRRAATARRLAPWTALPLALVLLSGPATATSAPQEKRTRMSISLYKVWASASKGPGACPAELSRYRKLLESKTRTKKARYNSFRLEGKPITRGISPRRAFGEKLPRKFTLSLTPAKEKGKWVLHYHLASADSKWSSKLTIRPRNGKPYVIIPDIRTDSEQFVMVLVCTLPGESRNSTPLAPDASTTATTAP